MNNDERRPGHLKLVYDKATRTIVAEGAASDELDRLRAENERLTRELEAAKKVADAAVNWFSCEEEMEAETYAALFRDALRYRDRVAPLSPAKQAVITAAADKTDEEWEEICGKSSQLLEKHNGTCCHRSTHDKSLTTDCHVGDSVF